MKPLTSIIVAVSLLLAGCQSSSQIRAALAVDHVTKATCDLLPPITYDGKLDTPETKAQIKQYNAKIDALCN